MIDMLNGSRAVRISNDKLLDEFFTTLILDPGIDEKRRPLLGRYIQDKKGEIL
jgi:hypothetical protein